MTQNHEENLDLVTLVAPGAQVVSFQADTQFTIHGKSPDQVLNEQNIRLLAILKPDGFDPQALRLKVRTLAAANVLVFINAVLTAGKDAIALVNDVEAAGAVTVGQLSLNGTVSSNDIPERKINLFAPYGYLSNEKNSALTVAGVGALLLSNDPRLSVDMAKRRLIETADSMWQASILTNAESNDYTIEENFKYFKVDPNTGDFSPIGIAYRFYRVNAANALEQTLAGQCAQCTRSLEESHWPRGESCGRRPGFSCQ